MSTTRQIEVFVKVAELGSVRHAAEQLGVSQPTLSKHLKAFESHVGGALFARRRGRRLQLSALGEKVLLDARLSLAASQRIDGRLTNTVDAKQLTVFVRSFMSDWVKANYAALQAGGIPTTTRFVLVDDTEDIEARVRATPDSLSIFRSAEAADLDGLRNSVIKTETFSLYAAPTLAAALTNGSLPARDVAYFHQRRRGEADLRGSKLLQAAGLEQAQWVEAPQFIEVLTENVVQGQGIGLFLDWHVRERVQAGELVRLSTESAVMHLRMIGHPSAEQSLFEKTALAFLRCA